jgi:aryl-alcohol dehydrogenase-like predicted oxidoreductase
VEYRNLGGSELRASVVALGGNTFGPPRISEEETHRVIHAAQDYGINFVDTAIGYGEGQSEKYLGTAMQGRRDKWLIATKFNFRGRGDKSAYDHIIDQCNTSLSKLQTDYIDLYQIHQPSAEVHEEEILRALDDLVRAGKVREIGSCNYQSWQMAENMFKARTLGTKHFITAQNHYNLLRRNVEQELSKFCDRYGASLIPFFPLAGGFLTGKYVRGEAPPPGSRGAEGSGIIKNSSTDRNWEILPGLQEFTAERGHTMPELALAWLLANPAVGCVITGVSNPEQVAMNAKAADWVLTAAEKQQVDAMAPRLGDDEGMQVGARAGVTAAPN